MHYAAWPELKQVAELLEAPVGTSMEGKSAFPETPPLALGAGGHDVARAGDSRGRIGRGLRRGRELQPGLFHQLEKGTPHLDQHSDRHPILGDSKLTLAMLHQALSERLRGKPRGLARDVAARIQAQNAPWLTGVDAASRATRSRSRLTGSSTTCCRPSTCRTRSSRTMPAARATS